MFYACERYDKMTKMAINENLVFTDMCVCLNQTGFRLQLRNYFMETPQILAVWAVLLHYKGEWSNTKAHYSVFEVRLPRELLWRGEL